jgi:hypothetical protein
MYGLNVSLDFIELDLDGEVCEIDISQIRRNLPSQYREGRSSIFRKQTKQSYVSYRLTVCYQIYWTKNVTVEGSDRLPALSTAMSVIVLSPVSVTYTTARSPVVVWSRTPFR